MLHVIKGVKVCIGEACSAELEDDAMEVRWS